jgi:hypothetical protein
LSEREREREREKGERKKLTQEAKEKSTSRRFDSLVVDTSSRRSSSAEVAASERETHADNIHGQRNSQPPPGDDEEELRQEEECRSQKKRKKNTWRHFHSLIHTHIYVQETQCNGCISERLIINGSKDNANSSCGRRRRRNPATTTTTTRTMSKKQEAEENSTWRMHTLSLIGYCRRERKKPAVKQRSKKKREER